MREDGALWSRLKSLWDDIDEELDVPVPSSPPPGPDMVVVQLDEFGLPAHLPNPPNPDAAQLDEYGLPNLRWPTCGQSHARVVDEPCISTVSLKGMPLPEINCLWFDDIQKKRLADLLSELYALMLL